VLFASVEPRQSIPNLAVKLWRSWQTCWKSSRKHQLSARVIFFLNNKHMTSSSPLRRGKGASPPTPTQALRRGWGRSPLTQADGQSPFCLGSASLLRRPPGLCPPHRGAEQNAERLRLSKAEPKQSGA
jgi:hypothetical protein